MANTAWGVISWVSVEMDVAEWKGLLRSFRHSVTSIHGETDEYGCHYGYTLWKANHADRPDTVGMAWDWREMQPGVVGQDDPMSILTNVRLTKGGRPLSASETVLALNDAVYRIGWQRVARRQLQMRAAEMLQRLQPGAAGPGGQGPVSARHAAAALGAAHADGSPPGVERGTVDRTAAADVPDQRVDGTAGRRTVHQVAATPAAWAC